MVLFFLDIKLYWHFWMCCDFNLKLSPGKNTQKFKKQKEMLQKFGIRNWLFDELNEVLIRDHPYITSAKGLGGWI